MIQLQQQLSSSLASMGIDLQPHQQALLIEYLGLMAKWNQTYNLTAIHDPERMLTHHLLDSLAILPHVGAGPLLDVGSGAGLPGLPLAIARPDLAVTVMDASQKKCGFMQQAVIELKLANVSVVHARAENYRHDGGFPQIVSRAFTDLNEYTLLTRHLLASGGEWLAMKGLYPDEEIMQLQSALLKRDVRLGVPNLKAERHLIIMEAD